MLGGTRVREKFRENGNQEKLVFYCCNLGIYLLVIISICFQTLMRHS